MIAGQGGKIISTRCRRTERGNHAVCNVDRKLRALIATSYGKCVPNYRDWLDRDDEMGLMPRLYRYRVLMLSCLKTARLASKNIARGLSVSW